MKVIAALLLILAVVVGWAYYERHDPSNSLGNGAITARDGGPVDKSTDNPAMSDSHAATTESQTNPPIANGAATNQPPNYTQTSASVATSTNSSLPADNTQSSNAPDQLRFVGAGRYQWYRQGDLTWRIDTVSGAMCVAFATMPEWRKADVISHGCGNA